MSWLLRDDGATGRSDGFATVGEQGAEACTVCECNWFEPAAGSCRCGHSIVEHEEVSEDEPADESPEPRPVPWQAGLAGDDIVR